MLVSVMFQQMYNIADSIVAGKFVGVGALAAVGASYPITMIFMAVATGLNIGCSVVISLYFIRLLFLGQLEKEPVNLKFSCQSDNPCQVRLV